MCMFVFCASINKDKILSSFLYGMILEITKLGGTISGF